MTTAPRVVVTGIGAVTPLGPTLADTCAALARGDSPFARPSLLDTTGFTETLAAEVRGFDPAPYFRVRKALKLANRITRFAVAAAAMALDDGGWPAALGRDEMGVIVGTSGFDVQVDDVSRALAGQAPAVATADVHAFADRVLDRLTPLWLLVGLPNMASSHVAIQLEARGPNSTTMTDWIAGSQAIGEAVEWIRSGEAAAVLAGGADTALVPHTWAAFDRAGVFDAQGREPRFIPGEGAAVLLLERRDDAIARGARIRGEITGYATSAAAGNPLTRTMAAALAQAGAGPRDVAIVATAATLAEPYRTIEREAVSAVVGDVAHVEFTPRLGHAFAAAGAIDVALVLALQSTAQGTIVCNALGFGGQATTLALTSAAAAARA